MCVCVCLRSFNTSVTVLFWNTFSRSETNTHTHKHTHKHTHTHTHTHEKVSSDRDTKRLSLVSVHTFIHCHLYQQFVFKHLTESADEYHHKFRFYLECFLNAHCSSTIKSPLQSSVRRTMTVKSRTIKHTSIHLPIGIVNC